MCSRTAFELINELQAQVVSPAHGMQDVMLTPLSACEIELSVYYYYSTYVLLAEHLSCPIASLDKDLRKTAKRCGIAIVALDLQ